MKYFTPERWLRMQSGGEPQAALAALEEWYRAIDEYRDELKRILPEGERYEHLRRFACHECLHDGLVLASWFAGGRLHLVVRPEPPATRLVSLAYTLAGEPAWVTHAFPDPVRTGHMEWMYDEISLLDERPSPGGEQVFAHNVLLGNGWELCIPFTQLKLSRPSPWLPSVGGPVGSQALASVPAG